MRQDLVAAVNLLAAYVSQNLPDGWEIVLQLTREEADIDLFDPGCNKIEEWFGDDSVIVQMCEHAVEAEAAYQEAEANKKIYLIECVEHAAGDLRLWWKPERKGYTTLLADAGRYSLKEARDICGDGKDEVMWTEQDAVNAARHVVLKARF